MDIRLDHLPQTWRKANLEQALQQTKRLSIKAKLAVFSVAAERRKHVLPTLKSNSTSKVQLKPS